MIEAVLLCNPAAGRFPLSQRRLGRLREKLYRYGIRTTPVLTTPELPAPGSLDLKEKQLLIVYGGDGTVHRAIQEAVRWKVPVALLPAGTVNILARELEIPQNLDRALQVIVRGEKKRIHLGRASGEYFHLMAGIGPDGYIIRSLKPGLKRTFGAFSYWMVGLKNFWAYPLPAFEVDLEGERHQATFVVIGNARSYGGQLLITPRASVYEQALDVCVFTASNHLRFFAYLFGALRGTHLQYPDVVYRKVRRLSVSGDPSVLVQMDGEVVGRLPLEFLSCQESLEVIAPPGAEGEPRRHGGHGGQNQF